MKNWMRVVVILISVLLLCFAASLIPLPWRGDSSIFRMMIGFGIGLGGWFVYFKWVLGE